MKRVLLPQFGSLCHGLVSSKCFVLAVQLVLSLGLFLLVSFSTRYVFVLNLMFSKIPSFVCNELLLQCSTCCAWVLFAYHPLSSFSIHQLSLQLLSVHLVLCVLLSCNHSLASLKYQLEF